MATDRGPKPHPKSRTTKKKHRVHANFFVNFTRTLAFFPVTQVRNPNGNCSVKLVQMNSFYLGGFFSVGFSSSEQTCFARTILSCHLACMIGSVVRVFTYRPPKTGQLKDTNINPPKTADPPAQIPSYRCILNYYPISSKAILWDNFKITPLKINFDEIFWRQFLPQRLPAVASLHSMLQNYPA